MWSVFTLRKEKLCRLSSLKKIHSRIGEMVHMNNVIHVKSSIVVQSLSHVQLFATHGLQHTRLPCPSPSPGACSSSCPLSWWCHSTISSSHPLLLLPSIFPSIRVFPSDLAGIAKGLYINQFVVYLQYSIFFWWKCLNIGKVITVEKWL